MNKIIDLNENDFDGLIDILESKGFKMSISFNQLFNTINFYNQAGCELYLRSSYDNYITIVRINLIHKHQGLGTEILNWLKEYAKQHGFIGVKIESVCTKAMDNFCKKHKFIRMHSGIMINGFWHGDYKLDNKI